MLLATTVYLDFGLGFAGGEYPTTVAALRRADGGLDTGPDLVGEGSPTALAAGNDLKFRVLRYNYNNDEKTDNDDVAQLQNAVVPIVKRALSPFDVDVQLARAKDFHDVRKSLDSNNNHANGEFDAYVFLTEVVSSVYGGGSVGAAMGSAGKAAATDGLLGDNRTDEVVVTFADHILATTAGDARKDVFNNKLAYRLAYTAVHEAAHSLGLAHTLGYDGLDPISNQVILTRGDQIRFASDTRETENVFTRFDLALQLTAGLQNSYGKLRDDADIGLGDRDRDGVPDFAYVTGTGAHDRIEIK
ncbi:MAG TPA: hypothetical protein VF590_17120, partial [Isosphaeraceae bacterium]